MAIALPRNLRLVETQIRFGGGSERAGETPVYGANQTHEAFQALKDPSVFKVTFTFEDEAGRHVQIGLRDEGQDGWKLWGFDTRSCSGDLKLPTIDDLARAQLAHRQARA